MIRIMIGFDNIVGQFKRNAPTLISALLVMYFLSHALSGANSLKALNQLDADQAYLLTEAQKTQNTRSWLQHRADLLRSDKVDPDLLDELARQRLSVGQSDEVTFTVAVD